MLHRDALHCDGIDAIVKFPVTVLKYHVYLGPKQSFADLSTVKMSQGDSENSNSDGC